MLDKQGFQITSDGYKPGVTAHVQQHYGTTYYTYRPNEAQEGCSHQNVIQLQIRHTTYSSSAVFISHGKQDLKLQLNLVAMHVHDIKTTDDG